MDGFGEKLHFVKRKFLIRHHFIKSSQYLETGKYRYAKSMKHIYLDREDVRESSYEMFYRPCKTSWLGILRSGIYYTLFRYVIKVENTTHKFEGQIYVPGNDGNVSLNKRAKIFDLNKMQILELFDNKTKMSQKLKVYKQYHRFFNMPKILSVNKEEGYIIEKCLKDEKSKKDVSVIIEEAMKMQLQYMMHIVHYKMIHINKNDIYDIDYKIRQRFGFSVFDYMTNNIELYCNNMPKCFQHGDLWYENFIIARGKVYIIDYEYSGHFWFCYDFFSYMIRDYIRYDRVICVDYYLEGRYDDLLANMFKEAGLSYNEAVKIDYFALYILYKTYKKTYEKMPANLIEKSVELLKYMKEKS